MKKNKRAVAVTTVGLALTALLLGAGQGGEGDPLITLSYLTDVFTPKIMAEVDADLVKAQADYVKELSDIAQAYEDDVADAMEQSGGIDLEAEASAVFQAVTVANGQTLTLSLGGEFILRSGTATCVAVPELMDSTSGDLLPNGSALEANHLYLALGDGQGLQATAAVTLLVRGAYTIA